jgi:hypothetical protein
LKNDLVQELTQASHDYEKLREGHPKIEGAEFLINVGLTFTSGALSMLLYHHLTKDISFRKPTEEEVLELMINGAKYGWASPSGSGGSITYEVETREEAIKHFIQQQEYQRFAESAVCYSCGNLIGLLLFYKTNPGEKILKLPYMLSKTLVNSGRELKSYLKRIQELKQKRKEVISYER